MPQFDNVNSIYKKLKEYLSFRKLISSIFLIVYRSPSVRGCKNYLLAFLGRHLVYYPTPINLIYAWSFGSLAGVCLLI